MRAIASCLPLLLVLTGCARRLPGPLECRSFALASIGIDPRLPQSAVERDVRLAERIDDVTRECLTTPWDYQLMNCIANSRNSRACFTSFEVRRRQPLLPL
jgi:hypothetical protein